MEKNILIIVFSLLLASCSHNDENPSVATPPADKKTIAFNEAQTRAPLNTVYSTFGLNGIATTIYNTTTVFNNQKVEYDAGNNFWSYSPLKYWDTQADHKFAAYAPYDVSRNFSFNVDGDPQITNFMVQQNVANQEALLLSRPVERNLVAGNLNTSPVVFSFDPAVIKINVKIKKDAGINGIINLNGLRMYNMKSSGNCVHDGNNIVWDTSAATNNTFGYSTSFASARQVTEEGITAWEDGLLMIPQPVSGITIYLSYTHRPGEVTYSYDKDNITLPGTDWEPGKQITYVLTLKPQNTIEIGEPIVEPWIDISPPGGTIIVD